MGINPYIEPLLVNVFLTNLEDTNSYTSLPTVLLGCRNRVPSQNVRWCNYGIAR